MDDIGMWTALTSVIGIIYFLFILFAVILSIVLTFKVMNFMKRKTNNDERLIQAIEKLGQNHVSGSQSKASLEEPPHN
ncbi:hypothetical protein [Alkalihalobacillus sp. AL-G]|uniref:hypothetical protein n=1 Tax=Alkalihalobacillus sp. AL-G TaxID=2926399 RepID=UPI00272AA5F7|nr:hypothetical protein [Alkalihalobacillus sp. AL-G]WLD93906.1 hypothetical protein MOJ78_03020 [Alkalihalobacillus sp. AL-G]